MEAQQAYPRFLGGLLSETAARLPEKEALVFNEERVTWAEFDRRVNRLAHAWLEMGIQRGDRIGVISTTRPEYLYAYLAAARIGAILVGFNIVYTPLELTRLANLTRPVAMVVLGQAGEKQVAASLQPLIASWPFVKHLSVIGTGGPAGTPSLNDLLAANRPGQQAALAARAAQLDENDGVLIVFTSGSTGLAKGAVLTHKNIIDNIAVETRQFGIKADDRVLLHLPMSHVGGATELTVPALMTGATLIVMDHFHPVHTLETVAKERVTVLGQVPTMYILEFNLPNYAGFDRSSLRKVLVAGAATPLPVMEKMQQMAPVTITGYGMTEVAGFVTYTQPNDDGKTIALTVGAVAPEFALRVVDDQQHDVALGEVGEVAVRGTCVMKEYFDNPAETAAAIDSDGWFYTGDLGKLDARGYLTLVDRKKDMYITGGYNVYPREIEEHISRHPGVAFVACLGRKDDVMGEVGAVYVVPKPGVELSLADLQAHCQQGLAQYKIPKYMELRDKLPLTSLGKVDKMQLRRELMGN